MWLLLSDQQQPTILFNLRYLSKMLTGFWRAVRLYFTRRRLIREWEAPHREITKKTAIHHVGIARYRLWVRPKLERKAICPGEVRAASPKEATDMAYVAACNLGIPDAFYWVEHLPEDATPLDGVPIVPE